jgi:hypothetical protein
MSNWESLPKTIKIKFSAALTCSIYLCRQNATEHYKYIVDSGAEVCFLHHRVYRKLKKIHLILRHKYIYVQLIEILYKQISIYTLNVFSPETPILQYISR